MLHNLLLNNPAGADKLYVEDVFSTYLYSGGSSAIQNGIDLAGKGGLVWIKSRSNSSASTGHALFDTNRGREYGLASQTTAAQIGPSSSASDLESFNSDGFTVAGNNNWAINSSGITYASWSFRKSAKFFDVVTWTGNGVDGRQIAHSLGTTVGMIIVKCTSHAGGTFDGHWQVYHKDIGGINMWLDSNAYQQSLLNSYGSVYTWSGIPGYFELNAGVNDLASVNQSGRSYVAYLFAHDTTSDGIIKCGSYTGTGSPGNFVSLGWEPQWLLIKRVDTNDDWYLYDNMRGMPVGVNDATLFANMSAAESAAGDNISVNATGFTLDNSFNHNSFNGNYIYVAIRRGPMKTPTSGASVFNPKSGYVGSSNDITNSGLFPYIDAAWWKTRNATSSWTQTTRMTGNRWMASNSTSAEATNTSIKFNLGQYGYGQDFGLFEQTGVTDLDAQYYFRRAPGFLDIVCYTGTGANLTLSHNLGVVPELIIIKDRSSSNGWFVFHEMTGTSYRRSQLNDTGAPTDIDYSLSINLTAAPTSSSIFIGSNNLTNSSGNRLVSYLFASCPGVSKVGTYTGNGTSQTINCGFSAGARFVLIKRTGLYVGGDWWIWDTARGIIAGNDPRLPINTTGKEVGGKDDIDPDNSGFIVNQAAASIDINVSGATYLYLAIA